jgi:hypothetical protein
MRWSDGQDSVGFLPMSGTFFRRAWTIVTCMGRLEFVRRTLPAVLAGLDNVYCLVDYSCPDRAADWVGTQFPSDCETGRIVVVSCPGRATFHKAQALNAGARRAIEGGAEYLCFLDADSLPGPGLGRFLHEHVAPDRFLVELHGRSLFGFLVTPAAAFVRSGGFDEHIVGYGAEDIEMRLRLRLVLGLSYLSIPRGTLEALPHDGELRTRHYAERSAEVSNARNLAYVRARVRDWSGRDLFDLDPGVIALYNRPPIESAGGESREQRARRRALARARLRG